MLYKIIKCGEQIEYSDPADDARNTGYDEN